MSFEGYSRLYCLMDLNLIPFFCLLAYRMERGHKEASTSQVGRKRGTPWETTTVSSLVTAMFVEELRSFSQVHVVIRLEVSDGTAVPNIEGADNVVYFTLE